MSKPRFNITREEFREIYKGLPILAHEDLFFTLPKDVGHLMTEYFPSKLWRLNNIYTIIDKWGQKSIFTMNRAQHIVYATSMRHPRLLVLKSRQQGISTLWLISYFDDCFTLPDLSIGLMAQGQDEATTLLERTKLLWDELHPDFKNYLGRVVVADNAKLFKLNNDSKIFVRTSFRSTTLQRLHVSEMGKIANNYPEKAREVKTGTLQALAKGNTGVIESTAEGDNLFKDMWDNAVLHIGKMASKDFMPVFLSWVDDPDCVEEVDQPIDNKTAKYFAAIEEELGQPLTQQQKNFWIVQYRELSDRVYQEYPATATEAFMATRQGAYYAELYMRHVVANKREKNNLYDPNLPVQCAVDLGMNDTNSLTIGQNYRSEKRIIDEFADNGQKISYYTDWMKQQPWFSNLVHVILPHDAEVTSMNDGKTREDIFREELYDPERDVQIKITVLERTSNVNADIEHVRVAIHNLWIDKKCEYLRKCILGYKKEWDERRERWRDKPDHTGDESHGADSIRYYVLGSDDSDQTIRETLSSTKQRGSNGRRKQNTGFAI